MKDQLLWTWQHHAAMNIFLLDSISDKGLQATLNARGRTVAQQFIHLHNVRIQWLEICAADLFKKYTVLDKTLAVKQDDLKRALNASTEGIELLLARAWDEGGKVKGFKKGVIPLLGYFISHESHHRGNIMITLKQCGEKIADNVKWGLWEWGK